VAVCIAARPAAPPLARSLARSRRRRRQAARHQKRADGRTRARARRTRRRWPHNISVFEKQLAVALLDECVLRIRHLRRRGQPAAGLGRRASEGGIYFFPPPRERASSSSASLSRPPSPPTRGTRLSRPRKGGRASTHWISIAPPEGIASPSPTLPSSRIPSSSTSPSPRGFLPAWTALTHEAHSPLSTASVADVVFAPSSSRFIAAFREMGLEAGGGSPAAKHGPSVVADHYGSGRQTKPGRRQGANSASLFSRSFRVELPSSSSASSASAGRDINQLTAASALEPVSDDSPLVVFALHFDIELFFHSRFPPSTLLWLALSCHSAQPASQPASHAAMQPARESSER